MVTGATTVNTDLQVCVFALIIALHVGILVIKDLLCSSQALLMVSYQASLFAPGLPASLVLSDKVSIP